MNRRFGLTRRRFLTASLLAASAAVGTIFKASSRKDRDEPLGLDEVDVLMRPSGWAPGSIRPNPVTIPPLGDLADLVPEEPLRALLRKLPPCWPAIKTSKVMHAFRLWGPNAIFPDDAFARPFSAPILSGRQLADYLLDNQTFGRLAPGSSPLLLRTPDGVAVRTYADEYVGTFAGGLGHDDDLLAACGEVGLPAATAVVTESGEATVGDLVSHSISSFSIHQELEWTVEALARYLAPRSRWENRFGETFSFDQVTLELIARPLGKGSCLGTHVPNALVCLYRLAEDHPILSAHVKDRIAQHLKMTSRLITESRMPSGIWAGSWGPGAEAILDTHRDQATGSLVSTGHHLEWIALAPPGLRPERDAIRAAVEGILVEADHYNAYERSELYLEFSHLARGLTLLKNWTPSEVVGS